MLRNSEVVLSLELKPTGNDALDARLVTATIDKMGDGSLRAHTIFTGFALSQLTLAKRLAPNVSAGCYVPLGGGTEQFVNYLSGGSAGDVDACLRAGMDYVFVTPILLDGPLVAHVEHTGARLGVYGVNTKDFYDTVRAWGNRLDYVETDHPSIFGWNR
ncbi:MAG: hypothetical protein NVSMB1_15760 [Polyangiales bacterium]